MSPYKSSTSTPGPNIKETRDVLYGAPLAVKAKDQQGSFQGPNSVTYSGKKKSCSSAVYIFVMAGEKKEMTSEMYSNRIRLGHGRPYNFWLPAVCEFITRYSRDEWQGADKLFERYYSNARVTDYIK